MSLPESNYNPDEELSQVEYFRNGFPVDIVNANEDRELLVAARFIVAYSYQIFNPDLSLEVITQLLFKSDHEQEGRSTTLVALHKGSKEIMATLRFSHGQTQRTPSDPEPIEAMQLVEFPEWPHRKEGLQDYEIGESGRFAISPRIHDLGAIDKEVRRDMSARLLRDLTRGIFDIARESGIRQIYAIMPPRIYGLFEMEGIAPDLLTFSRLQNTPRANETFDNFPGYWRNPDFSPAIHRWKV